jgi:hypothetical protein
MTNPTDEEECLGNSRDLSQMAVVKPRISKTNAIKQNDPELTQFKTSTFLKFKVQQKLRVLNISLPLFFTKNKNWLKVE